MSKGLFLDLDGTLCDSLTALRQVWRDFLAGFGVAVADTEFELVNGPPIPEVVARLRTRYHLAGTQDDLTERYRTAVGAAHGAAPPAAGAADMLARARDRGWRVAVVTSNARPATEAWLARTDLARWVDLVVGGEDVAHGKPDPEPYRLALARLGCAAPSSLAVEDSAEGAMSACGAGLPTWVVDRRAADAVAGSPLFRGLLDGLAGIGLYL